MLFSLSLLAQKKRLNSFIPNVKMKLDSAETQDLASPVGLTSHAFIGGRQPDHKGVRGQVEACGIV